MVARGGRSRNEAEIRRLIDDRVKAIQAKDADAAMATSARDILLYDLAPPLEHRGAGVNRKDLAEWFKTFTGPVGYELRGLRITAGNDVAFCHGLARIRGVRTDGTRTDVWVRATVCLHKADGRWRITHEHVSVPFEMSPPFKASLDLKP
jgi:ketosteroid isomerase-like protein